MKRFLLFVFIITCVTSAAMAASYKITGRVVDTEGEPEAYATIRIFNPTDSVSPVTTGVTSDDGLILLTLSRTGNYIVKVSSIGRTDIIKEISVTQPSTDLGTLTIHTNENMLSEVTVTATRPLISKEIDRIGYDVQGDDESPTATLDEILRKVPLVSVDDDGTIKIKGSTNFKVYKDGKPNNMLTSNAKDIFRAIPASMIKKIEVITEPGAREDAEGVGAILNIVTMEAVQMGGVMGNVSLNYQTMSDVPTANTWISAQIKKLTLSLYGGFGRFYKEGRSRMVSRGVYTDSGNVLTNENSSDTPGWLTFFGLDGSYDIDSLNLITAELGGYYYTMSGTSNSVTTLSNNLNSPLYSYSSRQRVNPMSYLDFNGGLNYQHSTHRPDEHITLSYLISTTNQHSNTDEQYDPLEGAMPVPYTGIIQNYRLRFLENTFQADWSRPYAEVLKVDLGLKYIHRTNRSKTYQDYLGIDNTEFINFRHTTQVAAAYADFRLSFGKVGLRAGLRYEYSRLSAKYADGSVPSFSSNLNDWVPNAAVSYSVNDGNMLKLSFGTRIARPGIDYLNPAVNESPTATSQGNPYLESGRNSSLTFNYNFIGRKVNLDFSAGYSFNNNDIVQVISVENDHTYSSYANAGHNKSANFSLYAQWTAGKKTSVMFNGSANYDHYANPSLDITHGGWSGYFFTRLSQKLPWGITGNLGLFYWAGSVSGLYSTTRSLGMTNWFLSLQKSFLKEDRLTVRLSMRAPSHRTKTTYYNTAFQNIAYNHPYSAYSFGISVSYRFGSLNASVKKTAKTIENDDLDGRHSGGNGGSGNDASGGMM